MAYYVEWYVIVLKAKWKKHDEILLRDNGHTHLPFWLKVRWPRFVFHSHPPISGEVTKSDAAKLVHHSQATNKMDVGR